MSRELGILLGKGGVPKPDEHTGSAAISHMAGSKPAEGEELTLDCHHLDDEVGKLRLVLAGRKDGCHVRHHLEVEAGEAVREVLCDLCCGEVQSAKDGLQVAQVSLQASSRVSKCLAVRGL